ncbi:MAG: hypothetical protein WA843_02180, partial [Candidatus Saccharimonadales bacterium]
MSKKPLGTNRKTKKPSSRGMKNVGFIALLALFALIIFAASNQPSTLKKIPITTAVQDSNSGR